MQIYFACSITGGRADEETYRLLVNALLADGHNVPTSHLAVKTAVSVEKDINPVEVYTRDVDWIKSSDVLVAEVSTPSHGVGYEICYALDHGKPVLCLHEAGTTISKMLSGNTHPNITVHAYRSPEDALDFLRIYLQELQA
jgi:nucleoside 2-deoxyribosyltransferase